MTRSTPNTKDHINTILSTNLNKIISKVLITTATKEAKKSTIQETTAKLLLN